MVRVFSAHKQPEGHQRVVLKSYRKLKTHFTDTLTQFPLVGHCLGRGSIPELPHFQPGDAISHHLLTCSVTSSCCFFLSTLECTELATNWKSNKILIISCQLFNVFFHSKMSSGWQQHAECNCACAAAWWGSSPEGFPSRHIFTHQHLPNGLEQFCVYWYHYQHCYHQSQLFGTPDSFTRAM